MRGATVNRRAAALGLLLGALRQPAQAQQAAAAQAPSPPAEVAAALPDARWRGSAVMRFFGLHIYDARLWSAAPLAGDGAAQPLALELIYARSLVGEQIASRSIKEMQGIGVVTDAQAARWLAAMTKLFPDVKAGDRITGVQAPGQGTRFFFNGGLRGEVADADFTRLFFGIWLSPKTSEPRLRQQLLGGAP
jgi:hypothetical protein